MYINDITSVIKNIVYSINMDSEYLKMETKDEGSSCSLGVNSSFAPGSLIVDLLQNLLWWTPC